MNDIKRFVDAVFGPDREPVDDEDLETDKAFIEFLSHWAQLVTQQIYRGQKELKEQHLSGLVVGLRNVRQHFVEKDSNDSFLKTLEVWECEVSRARRFTDKKRLEHFHNGQLEAIRGAKKHFAELRSIGK